MTETASEPGWSERALDQVLPDDLDWRDRVGTYPLVSLAVAAGLGFLLGRSRGRQLVAAITGFAADRVSDSLNAVLDPPEG